MKGTIEITQGAVYYIIIALLVVVLSVAIIFKSNFLAFFGINEIKTSFDAGDIEIFNDDYAIIPTCDKAGYGYISNVKIKNLKLGIKYPGNTYSNDINVFIVSHIGQYSAPGKQNANEPSSVINCKKDGKGFSCDIKELDFDFGMSVPSGNQMMYITVWESTSGVLDFVNRMQTEQTPSNPISLADMLDTNYYSYMGSVPFNKKESYKALCQDAECKLCGGSYFDINLCDRVECERKSFCWFRPLSTGIDSIGSCSACITTKSCLNLPDANACNRCSSDLNCSWAYIGCVEKPQTYTGGQCSNLDEAQCRSTKGCWFDGLKCFDCLKSATCSTYQNIPDACNACPVGPDGCMAILRKDVFSYDCLPNDLIYIRP